MTPGTPTPTASGGTGAATPGAAVSAFMAAAKVEDLQALAAVWGTAEGSIRDQISRSELEMREVYIVKCLRHDQYTVLSDGSAPAGKRLMNVQLKRGTLTRATNFTLVASPQGRWYVERLDLEPLNDICLAR